MKKMNKNNKNNKNKNNLLTSLLHPIDELSGQSLEAELLIDLEVDHYHLSCRPTSFQELRVAGERSVDFDIIHVELVTTNSQLSFLH
jgi:hypothetical protein